MDFPSTFPKKSRACLNCCIILTAAQFKKIGCPNCKFFNNRKRIESINDTTSDSFKGMIGVIYPQQSWVAKWQRLNENVPGLYAMNVDGALPDEYINCIEDLGK
ncbi:transcription elongation factor spt4, partial [Conglomerata obtusa]